MKRLSFYSLILITILLFPGLALAWPPSAPQPPLVETDPIVGAVTGVVESDGAGNISGNTITGTGSVVKATSPTLVTPALGTPSAAVLTSATGLPLTTGVTGTLPVENGGTEGTTFTDGGILLGSGTAAFTPLAPAGTNGYILENVAGSDPQWVAPTGTNAPVRSANPTLKGTVLFDDNAGGTTATATIDSSGNLNYSQALGVAATKRIYLDGGSDTYFYESSADVLQFVIGSIPALSITETGGSIAYVITSGVNTTFQVESTAVDGNPFFSLKNDAQDWHIMTRGAESDAFVIRDNTGGVGNALTILPTGDAIFSDDITGQGNFTKKTTVTTDTTDGASTHTAAEMLGGLIIRSGITAGSATDVTDTAANIVAAISGCVVGSSFEFSIQNQDADSTIILDNGVGVTMAPNDPSTAIPAVNTGRFLAVVTNATVSSEAVTVHALGYSVH